MSKNLFKIEWDALEKPETQPRHVRSLVNMSFEEFKAKVYSQEKGFVKSVVESVYSGDIYILRNAFSSDFMIDLRERTYQYGKAFPSVFHKMLDDCPDFHRMITPEVAKNYAMWAVRHSYYFFQWNADPLKILELVNERWRVFKFFGGFPRNAYEENIPSDGVVDRLQIAQYVSGQGELERHSDPYLYQKLSISGIMSKRGKDFKSGGVYAVSPDGGHMDLEDEFEIGDIYILYPTVEHGITTINPGATVNWDADDGRWFMGLYSNASDHMKNRHTCNGLDATIQPSLKKIYST
jgi:hypothetical protein